MARNGRLGLLGLGAGGLLLGHSLAYLLSFSAGDHRHAVLLITGHGYLSVAGWVAAGLAVSGAFCLVAGASRRRTLPGFTMLAAVQVAGFVVLEAGERVLAGLGPLDLALPVVVGIAVQVVVAFAAALVGAGLERIVIAQARMPWRDGARRVRVRSPETTVPGSRLAADPNPARAPPRLLPA